MKGVLLRIICCIVTVVWMTGCANIVPPSGGPKDEAPPKLRGISPVDSQLNTRLKKLELQFDEYITLSDATKEVQISPLLSLPLTITSENRRVTITIPDSLLLKETTYRITFGTAIRDLHEGNPYQSKGYTFSSGSYFDSLLLAGAVQDAHTGLPDSGAFVMLYGAEESDSAIVRHKPLYVTRTTQSGNFLFEGLPPRPFRIYALHDINNNLTFDGGTEWIGFFDSSVQPSAKAEAGIVLRTFPESLGDTSSPKESIGRLSFGGRSITGTGNDIPIGSYHVSADTNDIRKRTQDITQPIRITLGRKLAGGILASKVFLSNDSSGITMEAPLRISHDTTGLVYSIITDWREDAVYILRLQKGFAKDSAGNDLLPGRYTFRTKRDEDYGKLRIHLPTKYFGRSHILQVVSERDTIYQKPIVDTMVNLLRIQPGTYTMRIIEDANQNGRWDAGDLFLRRQPEIVVPYSGNVSLKAGWEQQIDFETPRKRKLDTDNSLTR